MTLVTMFNGASGPPNGCGAACGEIVAIDLADTVIGDDAVAGAARLEVRTSGLDVVSATRDRLCEVCVETVVAGCSCVTENVEIADAALRDDALAALPVTRFGDDVAGAVGGSSSSEDVPALVGADCSSTVDCASGVVAFSEDVPFVSVDGVDGDGFLSVADVAEESAALVEADEVALESVGSANATPGVVATAHPTPRATANAPTRPTYLT